MEIKKVGVVGCGLMGSGIALVSAQAGYQVVVSEINDALLSKGMGSISSFLANSVKKNRMTQAEMDATIARIKGTTNMNDFADCNLVIEAAIENMELKKKIFAQLDKICPKETILASNTSCLSVIEIAKSTTRADSVLGIHFFNPVPMMKLVEIVKTIATKQEIVDTAVNFGKSVGKTPIISPDVPGFIVNSLMIPLMLTAFRMYEAGAISKEDIDTGAKLGLGHPMGPLTLADLIGLDTVLFIANAVYDETKDSLYAPPIILKKMVAVGWLGRKSGKGFYDYSQT